MRVGRATGLQIAFLMYAVMILAVPLSNFALSTLEATGTGRAIIDKGTHFFLAMLVIAAFPSLRRFACEALARPIRRWHRGEVAVVALGKLLLPFATAGGLAAWLWFTQGPAGMERVTINVDREVANAYSGPGLVRMLLAVLVAPIVEELVFRGFIYRAFERQWGWLGSMLVTSALFGVYHTHFFSAFASSIVFVCLLRRTGSLWAPVLAHALYNLMLWWPLLGQYAFPHGVILSDVAIWHWRFTCLAFVIVALPLYVWMARDRHEIPRTVFLEPDAALQK